MNNIKKIDFIISSLHGGGAERVMVSLANEFVERGYLINLITFSDPDVFEIDPKVKRIRLHNGKIKNHTLRCFFNLLKYYRNKKKRPDVIISFIHGTNLISIIVAYLLRIKVIASEHTNHTVNKARKTKFARKYVYRYANFVTVLTSFDLKYYFKNRVKAVVVPNPVSFEVNNENIGEKENVILAAGSLDRYDGKGFENLLYLLQSVFKKHPDWKLKIVGDGKVGLKYLESVVSKLHLENNVEFPGFIKDISQIMRSSDIYVLSSKYEGLPMVLIEAMSQGMACIAYDCVTGPSDIITHEEDGLLIEDQNDVKMAEGISTLIENEELRKRLAAKALKSVSRFHMDKIITAWEGLFKLL